MRGMAVAVAVVALAMMPLAMADSFAGSIGNTRCNTDPSRGEVQNMCGTLYNAVCGGDYCKCQAGMREHPTLHNCVAGGTGGTGGSSDGEGHGLDDLPFDYMPPGHPTSSVDITATRCSRNNDPCRTLHGAVCRGSHCVCPHGTLQNSAMPKCDPIVGGMADHDHSGGDGHHHGHFQGDHDHFHGDGHDHIHHTDGHDPNDDHFHHTGDHDHFKGDDHDHGHHAGDHDHYEGDDHDHEAHDEGHIIVGSMTSLAAALLTSSFFWML